MLDHGIIANRAIVFFLPQVFQRLLSLEVNEICCKTGYLWQAVEFGDLPCFASDFPGANMGEKDTSLIPKVRDYNLSNLDFIASEGSPLAAWGKIAPLRFVIHTPDFTL